MTSMLMRKMKTISEKFFILNEKEACIIIVVSLLRVYIL